MAEVGRPTDYSEELAREICQNIASSSKGLKTLCEENPHFPTRQTIHAWRINKPEFSYMYINAKISQVETLVDECLDIADDSTYDTITKTTKNGDEYEAHNTEWANRSRLRIDTRKWLAQKLAPKIYGEPKTNISADDKKSLVEQLIDKL